MKLLTQLLFSGVVLAARLINGQQSDRPLEEEGQCNCTKIANKHVQCIGNSMANCTATIRNDTLSYMYTGKEPEIHLGLVNFSHLQGLTTLYIDTLYDDYVFSRSLNFNASHQSVFKPLSNLEVLTIRINWNMSEPMPEMFSYLTRLGELDLSFTRYINYTSLQQSFKGLQNNCFLKIISLVNTQTFSVLENGMTLNLSNFLEPIAHCPLEHLDLSYNSLKTVYPGLIRFAPKLKRLDITHNLLTPLITSAFFFEVILHPTLLTVNFSRQGHGMRPPNIPSFPTQGKTLVANQASPHKKMEPAAQGNAPAGTPLPQLQLDVYRFLPPTLRKDPSSILTDSFSKNDTNQCLEVLRTNVCRIYEDVCKDILDWFRTDHKVLCVALEHIFEKSFGGIPCEYIPKVDDLLAKPSQCGGCLIFPTAGNVRNITLSENIYYDQATLPPKMINKTKCFYPNKIEFLRLSNNYPFGFPDIDKSLNSPVTGFPNLTEVQLANCGLKEPYFNFSASFPSLKKLDLSKNKLTLKADPALHYFIGPPTVTVFRLTANKIYTTPEKTLQTMTALEELYIDDNLLPEFTMNLTELPRLAILNLTGNHITSISKNMMSQFDAHAQRVNGIVEIDLRNNRLLCTCNERDFVRWLQTDKHHNLKFVGMNNITCLNDQSNIVQILDVNLDNMTFHCLSSYVYVSISAAAAVILAALFVAFGTCAYRKRWWFRYRYYLITKMYKQQQQREEAHRNYQYDAFVSYNSRDELWINDELQPKLEDEFGLKLCLHERDFVLGGNIIEQISSSIENSRKTLLILSPNFLASTWCHWEMNLAHNRLLSSGQDVLLLAILSPMSKVKMSRVLKDLLERKTYVMWTQDRDGQKLFWEKLQQAIRADRIEPYDLEDRHSWEETQPLLVNEQARGAR